MDLDRWAQFSNMDRNQVSSSFEFVWVCLVAAVHPPRHHLNQFGSCRDSGTLEYSKPFHKPATSEE